MEYLDFSIEMCRNDIHRNKKYLTMNSYIILICGLAIAIMSFIIYHDKSNWIAAIALGINIFNFLFSLSHLSTSKTELKGDIERLSRLEQMKDDENYQDSIKYVKRMKEYYEDLIRSHQHINGFSPENKLQESKSPKAEK